MSKKRKKAPSIVERLKAGETAEEIFKTAEERQNKELAKGCPRSSKQDDP